MAVKDEKQKLDANIGWTLFFQKLDFQGAIGKLDDGRIDVREILLYFSYGQHISIMKRIMLGQYPFINMKGVIQN